MTSSFHRSAALLAALFALGCGGLGITDGGPVGTGITASVVGNVVAVEDPEVLASLASPSAASDPAGDSVDEVANLAGIEVSLVEDPEVATTTDDEGNFDLDGDFAGALTLRFRTTDLEVEQAIDVPSGGVVVLSDIQLERDGVTAEAGRQLGLEARVRTADCGSGRLTVEDRGGDLFDVSLIDDTEFVRNDEPVTCEDLSPGLDVAIDGLFADGRGRALTALVVTLEPDSSMQPPPERRVAFVGDVAAIDCDVGSLLVHDGQHGIRVRLTAETTLRTKAGRDLTCTDLALGDRIGGSGLLDLKRPGTVEGRLLVVGARLGPNAELPIRGLVVETMCDEGILLLDLDGAVVTVRLRADTRLTPNDVTCDRLSRGDWWVRGKGVVSQEVPGALDAVDLDAKRIRPPR